MAGPRSPLPTSTAYRSAIGPHTPCPSIKLPTPRSTAIETRRCCWCLTISHYATPRYLGKYHYEYLKTYCPTCNHPHFNHTSPSDGDNDSKCTCSTYRLMIRCWSCDSVGYFEHHNGTGSDEHLQGAQQTCYGRECHKPCDGSDTLFWKDEEDYENKEVDMVENLVIWQRQNRAIWRDRENRLRCWLCGVTRPGVVDLTRHLEYECEERDGNYMNSCYY